MVNDKVFPPIVYKYRKWDNGFHQRIIKNNEVYFSAPKDFEDTLDCNPTVIYPKGHDLFIYLLNYSFRYNLDFNYVRHIQFASDMYHLSPMSFPDALNSIKHENDDRFNKRFGVLSVTVDCANDYMWNEYADKHRGFCVGFDTRKIFYSFKCGCGFVQYKDSIPPIDFVKDSIDEKIIKTVFYKEKKWEKEKEFRFHRMWSENEKIDRNCKLLFDSIKEVIIGNKMPQSFKEEISRIVNKKYPKIILRNEKSQPIKH